MRLKQSIAIAVLALTSAATAMAGLVLPQRVVVTLNADGSGAAFGDMVAARFSKNKVELIGCGVRRLPDGAGGVFMFAFCRATTADEVASICTTDDPILAEAVSAISDNSFLTFSWNAEGICQSIGSSTQSVYIPK